MELPLKFTAMESAQAHHAWRASCGPHSIAAACGLSLSQVRPHLLKFNGWMNPTMVGEALRSIRAEYRLVKGLRTKVLCNGVNRVQWEGPWLEPGVPPAVAYHHTHWVAQFDGLVLCAMLCASEWRSVDEWSGFLAVRNSPWHVTHHYSMARPGDGERAETCPTDALL